LIPAFCAALVLVVGKWLAIRKTVEPEVIDLVDESVASGVVDRSPNAQKMDVVADKED